MLFQTNGARIFFDVETARVVWGEDRKEMERPTLLMLPGGPGASHMHYKRPEAGFDRLTKHFQTIYVDWPGASRSDPIPPEETTLQRAADDVEALREALGIEKWMVLGASGGGIWGLQYAGTYPESVTHLLVIHSIGTTDAFGTNAEDMARRAGVVDEEAIRLYRGFVSGGIDTEPVEQWADSLRSTIVTVQNALYNDALKHPEMNERRTKIWNELADPELQRELDVSRWYLSDIAANYDVRKVAGAIKCPTLVITGENDPVAPPSQSESIHEALPNSELWIHPGYHMPHGEDEVGPFFDRIERFLRDHGAIT